jgi:hypothetical protein
LTLATTALSGSVHSVEKAGDRSLVAVKDGNIYQQAGQLETPDTPGLPDLKIKLEAGPTIGHGQTVLIRFHCTGKGGKQTADELARRRRHRPLALTTPGKGQFLSTSSDWRPDGKYLAIQQWTDITFLGRNIGAFHQDKMNQLGWQTEGSQRSLHGAPIRQLHFHLVTNGITRQVIGKRGVKLDHDAH